MKLLQQLPITNLNVPVRKHSERPAEQPLKPWQRMYRFLTNWTDTQMEDFMNNVSFAVCNIVIPALIVYSEGQFLLRLDFLCIGLCKHWRTFLLLFLVLVYPMVKEMMMMKLTQAQVQTLEPPAKDPVGLDGHAVQTLEPPAEDLDGLDGKENPRPDIYQDHLESPAKYSLQELLLLFPECSCRGACLCARRSPSAPWLLNFRRVRAALIALMSWLF